MTRKGEREQLTQENSTLREAIRSKDEELEQLREVRLVLREGLRQAVGLH